MLRAGYYEAYYGKALRVRRKIAEDFARAFTECDVLATPTSPVPAFKLGERMDDPLQMYLADIYTVAPALAGVPAMSQCCGFTTAGLPIGLQLIGPPLGEETVFRVGGAYERGHRLAHPAAARRWRVVSALEKYEAVIGLEVHVQLADAVEDLLRHRRPRSGPSPTPTPIRWCWGCRAPCRC